MMIMLVFAKIVIRNAEHAYVVRFLLFQLLLHFIFMLQSLVKYKVLTKVLKYTCSMGQNSKKEKIILNTDFEIQNFMFFLNIDFEIQIYMNLDFNIYFKSVVNICTWYMQCIPKLYHRSVIRIIYSYAILSFKLVSI